MYLAQIYGSPPCFYSYSNRGAHPRKNERPRDKYLSLMHIPLKIKASNRCSYKESGVQKYSRQSKNPTECTRLPYLRRLRE